MPFRTPEPASENWEEVRAGFADAVFRRPLLSTLAAIGAAKTVDDFNRMGAQPGAELRTVPKFQLAPELRKALP